VETVFKAKKLRIIARSNGHGIEQAPAIALYVPTDANTDTVSVPLVAPLPTGPYAAVAIATPFAGWADVDG